MGGPFVARVTFLAKPVNETGGFWTVHWDTVVTSLVLGVLTIGFLWLVTRRATAGVPSKTQAFVELAVDFVNEQVKGIYNGSSKMVAPIALTTFVLVGNLGLARELALPAVQKWKLFNGPLPCRLLQFDL